MDHHGQSNSCPKRAEDNRLGIRSVAIVRRRGYRRHQDQNTDKYVGVDVSLLSDEFNDPFLRYRLRLCSNPIEAVIP
jgi:hypothetical protein